MGGDADRILKWHHDWVDAPFGFWGEAISNGLKNSINILSNVISLTKTIYIGQWEQAGITLADILEMYLGPIPEPKLYLY